MKTKTNYQLAIFLTMTLLGFQSCKENPETRKIDPPKQTIDYKYANSLEEEYKKTRGAIINRYLQIEDTREFWFDLEKLKEYIKYVEQEAQTLGYENLGIRIYNGAYPNDKSYPDPGYSTVFLVPTGNRAISKGSTLPFNINTATADENIYEIEAYNYGNAGKPPKELN